MKQNIAAAEVEVVVEVVVVVVVIVVVLVLVVVVVVASWDNSSITLNVAGAQRRPATFNVIELRAKSSS